MENLVLVVLVGAAALAMGVVAGFFWAGRLQARDDSRVAQAEAKLDAFRTDANEHFLKTATMFQSLGEQYRDLYRHMADGAEKLCDAELTGQKPGFFLPAEIEAVAETETLADRESETVETTEAAEAVEISEASDAEAAAEELVEDRPPADYVVGAEAEIVEAAEPVPVEATDVDEAHVAEASEETSDGAEPVQDSAPVDEEAPVVASDTPADNDAEAPRTYH